MNTNSNIDYVRLWLFLDACKKLDFMDDSSSYAGIVRVCIYSKFEYSSSIVIIEHYSAVATVVTERYDDLRAIQTFQQLELRFASHELTSDCHLLSLEIPQR